MIPDSRSAKRPGVVGRGRRVRVGSTSTAVGDRTSAFSPSPCSRPCSPARSGATIRPGVSAGLEALGRQPQEKGEAFEAVPASRPTGMSLVARNPIRIAVARAEAFPARGVARCNRRRPSQVPGTHRSDRRNALGTGLSAACSPLSSQLDCAAGRSANVLRRTGPVPVAIERRRRTGPETSTTSTPAS